MKTKIRYKYFSNHFDKKLTKPTQNGRTIFRKSLYPILVSTFKNYSHTHKKDSSKTLSVRGIWMKLPQIIFSNYFSTHSTALPPEGGEMPLLWRRGGDRYVPGNLGMKIILYEPLKNMGVCVQIPRTEGTG